MKSPVPKRIAAAFTSAASKNISADVRHGSHLGIATATIFLLAAAGMLQAQTATISGSITDASGGGIPAATVNITNLGTQATRTATTDDSGIYAIPNVPVGRYDVTVDKTGFTTLRFPGIELTVGQALTVSGSLQVGAVSQQVEVSSAVTPAIELDTAQISNIVDQRRIVDLPLLTRDPYSLVLLSPGVEQSNSALGGFSVNGQRERNNNFLLDGVDNNDASVPGIPGGAASLDPDSTQEFRVITNNFLPEYGRNTGAIVDVVTKSGTNDFHGSAYEFNRVAALSARDFFNPSPQPQNPFVRNDFGGSVGGPIWKNHTFFFFNSEWQRFRTTLTSNAAVPSAAFKTGIFSYQGQQIDLASPSSPNNAQGLPLDPTMQKILAQYPNPDGPAIDGIRGVYLFPSTSKLNDNATAFRVDHRFNDKYSVFARYNYGGASDPDTVHDDQLPGIGATATSQQTNAGAFNFTAAFRPNLVNEFRFGLNRSDNLYTCGGHNIIDQFSTPDPEGYGTDYIFNTSTNVPVINSFSCNALGDSNTQFRRAGTWQYVDNLSWVHGNHNIKVGGEFRYVFENGYDAFGARPQFWFNAFGDYGAQIVNCAGACANDEVIQTLGAALLGFGYQQQTQYFNAAGARTAANFGRYRQHEYGAFVQDVWKLRPNLTLNLGLRYEFDGVPFEVNGDSSNLFGNPAGPAPIVFTRVGPGTGRQYFNNDPYNIEPRVGLSWDPFSTGKTAFRVGYGIFHDRVFGNLFTNLNSNPPLSGSYLDGFFTVSSTVPPATLPTPSNAVPQDTFNGSVSILDQNLKTPYSQSWNVGLQRELGWDSVLEINYVGSSSHRLFRSVDGNPPQPALVVALIAQGVSPSDLQGGALRFNTFGQTVGNTALVEPVFVKSIGNATYNGLQTVVTKRLSHGVQIQAAYTWSHSIDDAQDPLEATAANRNIARNSFNLHEERGSSDFDLRHRLVLNYMFELPFGPGHALLTHGIAARVLGGWELAGISTFESGRPFDVFSTRDSEHTGLSGRPDLIGNPAIPAGSDETQTGPPASAFAEAPFGRPGSVGRNSFNGPRYYNTDVDLIKRIPITERISLQFRAEVYNIFNQVQFAQPGILGEGQPGNVIEDPGTFGRSLSEIGRSDGTTSARQIQLALKLVF